MRAFAKIVLVAAVGIALVAGCYLGIKGIFGGSTRPETTAAEAAADLLRTQVAELRKQLGERKDLVAKATRDLKAATAATTDRERSLYMGTATGYLDMLASGQASEISTLKGVEVSIASTTVNSTEVEEMRSTLKALAAQEFETASRTRADLLRKYRK